MRTILLRFSRSLALRQVKPCYKFTLRCILAVMQERRQSEQLSNTLLAQILGEQVKSAEVLSAVKTGLDLLTGPKGRIEVLETNASANKILVESHDRVYQYGKWASVPALALLHYVFKNVMSKVGL